MDIRCIRLVPYRIGDRVLLDIQQVVPLPEAADYQVRLRRKDQQRERARTDSRDFTRYHVVVDGHELPDENKRNAVRVMVEQLVSRGVLPSMIGQVLSRARYRPVEGELDDEESVAAALVTLGLDPARWFVDCPFPESGQTWVLTRQWGRNTERTLTRLAQAFPEAKVSFRRAEG